MEDIHPKANLRHKIDRKIHIISSNNQETRKLLVAVPLHQSADIRIVVIQELLTVSYS